MARARRTQQTEAKQPEGKQPEPSNLIDDAEHDPSVDQIDKATADQAAAARLESPAEDDTLDGSDEGCGTGGRKLVLSDPESPRKPRNGDEVRPRCQMCTTDDVAVLMTARRTINGVTYYYCPNANCNNSRKMMGREMRRRIAEHRPHQRRRPFIERP